MTCEQLLAAEVQKMFPHSRPIHVEMCEFGEGSLISVGDTRYAYDMGPDEDVTNTFRFILVADPTNRALDIHVPMPDGWMDQFARQF